MTHYDVPPREGKFQSNDVFNNTDGVLRHLFRSRDSLCQESTITNFLFLRDRDLDLIAVLLKNSSERESA